MIRLKQDNYRKTRGGYSRFLEVYCEHCGHIVALYQKDGPGPLKRMYIDRIVSPERLAKLQHVSVKRVPNLLCSHCKQLIGIPYVYKKEKRPAFRLFEGSTTKKTVKAK
jgi:hypothetical protein